MPPVDFAVLNELSFVPPAATLAEAQRWLLQLCQVMKRAAELQLFRLRTRDDFKQTPLVAGASGDVLKVLLRLDRDSREFLLAALDSPYLPGDDYDDQFLSHVVGSVDKVKCASAEGLLCAYVAETLAVSLSNRASWSRDQVFIGIAKEAGGAERAELIAHASRAAHLAAYARISWILRRTCDRESLLPSSLRPLPNVAVSDLLVNRDWRQFHRSNSKMQPAERTARLRQIAGDVAHFNGYEYCRRRSTRNQRRAGAIRQVFVSSFLPQGEELFLSTDFEKPVGAFEVCGPRGHHLGEWLFSGTKNGDADGSGHHDIHV